MAVGIGIDQHTSNCLVLFIPAASGIPEHFICAFGVICLVAAVAALQWTNMSQHFCCVSAEGRLNEVAVLSLDLDPLIRV